MASEDPADSVLVLSSRTFQKNYIISESESDLGNRPRECRLFLDLRLKMASGSDLDCGSQAIDWALAGVRVTLGPNRHRWVHYVDSRKGTKGENMEDEGETTSQGGVDVETGVGWDPVKKCEAQYEEIWK